MTGIPTLLKGGLVYDGSGGDPSVADVLIDGDLIAAVEPVIELGANSAMVIDAIGKHIMPGFVDVHSHDDLALLRPAGVEPKLRQGVTTTVIGNCGHGPAPTAADGSIAQYSLPVLGPFPDTHWPAYADFLADLSSARLPINALPLIPHTPVRAAVVGFNRVTANSRQRSKIAGLIADGLSAGAAGVSLGLMYSPGNFADVDELNEIGRTVARHDGLLVAHLRNEADLLLPSIDEFAAIAHATGVAVHISHLKVTSPRNFGLMPTVIQKLDALRGDGIDLTADIYPYEAGSTTVATLFPSWTTDNGVSSLIASIEDPAGRRRLVADLQTPWDDSPLENYYFSLGPAKILLAGFRDQDLTQFEGRSIADIAALRGQDPVDALVDLVRAEQGQLTVVLFQTDIDGVSEALAWPWTMIGSDGLPAPKGYVHPRLYGTFPRLLTEFAGPGKSLSLAEAVHRASRLAAERFGLGLRGTIAAGQAADLQVIDPATYRDRASFGDPRHSPAGLEHVFVGGQSALDSRGDSGRLLRFADRLTARD